MSTLLVLVVVGLLVVTVTLAVVAEPDQPATERRWNLRGRRPRTRSVTAPARAAPARPAPVAAPVAAPLSAPVAEPVTDPPRVQSGRRRRGELYRPPRWWQRLRSIVLLVILTSLVGATVAAIVGAVLALIGLGVREAVS